MDMDEIGEEMEEKQPESSKETGNEEPTPQEPPEEPETNQPGSGSGRQDDGFYYHEGEILKDNDGVPYDPNRDPQIHKEHEPGEPYINTAGNVEKMPGFGQKDSSFDFEDEKRAAREAERDEDDQTIQERVEINEHRQAAEEMVEFIEDIGKQLGSNAEMEADKKESGIRKWERFNKKYGSIRILVEISLFFWMFSYLSQIEFDQSVVKNASEVYEKMMAKFNSEGETV